MEGRADLRAVRRKKEQRARDVPPYQILFATASTFNHTHSSVRLQRQKTFCFWCLRPTKQWSMVSFHPGV